MKSGLRAPNWPVKCFERCCHQFRSSWNPIRKRSAQSDQASKRARVTEWVSESERDVTSAGALKVNESQLQSTSTRRSNARSTEPTGRKNERVNEREKRAKQSEREWAQPNVKHKKNHARMTDSNTQTHMHTQMQSRMLLDGITSSVD